MLLDRLHPLLGCLGPVVGLAEEFPLPFFETPQKLLASTANANVAGLFRRTALSFSNSASHLAGVKGDLGRSRDKGFSECGTELVFVGEIHHVCSESVKVGALVSQGNGAWVGFKRLLNIVSKGGGEVEVDKGFVVNVACVGYGQHLCYPKREEDLGPGLEGLTGLVIEVAEFGDIELECAWYFLFGAAVSWRHLSWT